MKTARVGEYEELLVKKNMLVESQTDKIRKRDRLNKQIAEDRAKINELDAKISRIVESGLNISNHAIERFKQRFMMMSNSQVKKILSHPDLLDKYRKGGPGYYSIPDCPKMKARIQDSTIVTVVNPFDLEVQFRYASEYVMYKVEHFIKQLEGKTTKPLSFERYISVNICAD